MERNLKVNAGNSPYLQIDLTNCDREPIRIPGSIQPHGFLLGLRSDGTHQRVVVASENTANYLQLPLSSVLGTSLEDLFSAEFGHRLHDPGWIDSSTVNAARFLGTISLPAGSGAERRFQVVGSSVGDLEVIEFEHTESEVSQADLNRVIAGFASTLEEPRSAVDLCCSATMQIRALTGFDRVMLYQFDAEGHGTVLAEDRNEKLPSYLGLRFPASDIPKQARELYLLNRIRIIPDVEYTPSPLVSTEGLIDPASVDLSHSVLRSVSPVHRDYMRNMGTISSMSVSIVSQGKLWGLISGHHSEPKSVPYLTRSACDVLTRILSAQLFSTYQASQMSRAIDLKSIHTQLLTYMAAGENYIDGLANHPRELCALTGAEGAAIVVD